MKALINKRGGLEIERNGKFREQSCPFHDFYYCGIYCPLFVEFLEAEFITKINHNFIQLYCSPHELKHIIIEDHRGEK